ncbi:TPA: hypothetical protein HA297_02870 [Candidatus Woesearchaeota archaeon]|nr:hypothetical protein [Candidatus Woesearchaeota archaeon]
MAEAVLNPEEMPKTESKPQDNIQERRDKEEAFNLARKTAIQVDAEIAPIMEEICDVDAKEKELEIRRKDAVARMYAVKDKYMKDALERVERAKKDGDSRNTYIAEIKAEELRKRLYFWQI